MSPAGEAAKIETLEAGAVEEKQPPTAAGVQPGSSR